jgi:hypothetical protein
MHGRVRAPTVQKLGVSFSKNKTYYLYTSQPHTIHATGCVFLYIEFFKNKMFFNILNESGILS